MSTAFPSRARHFAFMVLRGLFRTIPLRQSWRDAMRGWFSSRWSHWAHPPLPLQANGQPYFRRLRVHAGERAIGALPRRPRPLPAVLPATLVAFYLPQFHRIPENEAWWGEGFTEWRNVTRALPQFEGHFQPRLPGALGFYDLSQGDTLHRQAELAREYGISAFCFYFYWFQGKRLLDGPAERWLADPGLDMDLCLCWANEGWSRRWDGREQDVLIQQAHDPDDDLAFIAHVARFMRDPRYLRVRGRPLLLVYRPGLLPDAKGTTERWRNWCRENGLGEIFLAYVQSFEQPNPLDVGCDAAVEFPPNLVPMNSLASSQRLVNPTFRGEIFDWRSLPKQAETALPTPYLRFPGVNCGWDNEPRRPGAGRVLLHSSPNRYRDWLSDTILHRLATNPADQKLVFINAWNEWAEGAVLEPDLRWDHAWLEATRQALCRADATSSNSAQNRHSPCAVIHAWYPEILDELLAALEAGSPLPWRLVITTGKQQVSAIERRLARRGHAWEIIVCDNRGRDILPFLQAAAQLLDEGESVVLKLHTKRSPTRPDGAQWRRDLVNRLLRPGEVPAVQQRFADNPRLGLLAPAGHSHRLGGPMLGANARALGYAIQRIGLEAVYPARQFVAGSMFWIRLEALRPMLDAGWQGSEFEPEDGQLDGTLAHALERLFVQAAVESGFEVDQA